eukprot:6672752-Pyramimonas_sp.AAC.1
MGAPDPRDASDPQLIEASTKRALDGLKQCGVDKLVKRSEAAVERISARCGHAYKWGANFGYRIAKPRCAAPEFKWLEHRDDLFAPGGSMADSRVVDCGAEARMAHLHC